MFTHHIWSVWILVVCSSLHHYGGAYHSNQNPVWAQKPYNPHTFTPHIWSWLLCLSLYYHGRTERGNQNPRWAQKPCISLCSHIIFGPDYYSYVNILSITVGHNNQNPRWTPENMYSLTYCMFTHHIWSWLPCSPWLLCLNISLLLLGHTIPYHTIPYHTIVIRTHDGPQRPCIPLCSHTIFGPDYYSTFCSPVTLVQELGSQESYRRASLLFWASLTSHITRLARDKRLRSTQYRVSSLLYNHVHTTTGVISRMVLSHGW